MCVLDADLSSVTGPLRQNGRHHVGDTMRVLDAELSFVTGPLRQNSRHHVCSGCRIKLRGFIGFYPYSVACQLCASAVETHLRWAPARARKGPKDTSASCRMIEVII